MNRRLTGPTGFEHVAGEHRAVRERVGLFDQSSFAKMELVGSGVTSALQRLAVADVDRPVSSVIYTQMLNESAGIESDLTLCRLADDRYYAVTGTAFGGHDFGWIERHLPNDGSVHTVDVTSGYAVLNIAGPRARDVLACVTEEPVDDKSLRFARARYLTVGAAPVLAMRVSYTGELGFELHIPSEYAAHVYHVLSNAGQAFGMVNAGYRALNSLRMEKGNLAWAADMSPDYSPYHARMERFVSKRKNEFIGADALAKIADEGPDQLLCTFALSEKEPVNGGEAILRDGRVLGVTTSADFGHTVGCPIVYGYVPADEATHEDYEIEVYGKAVKAVRHERPMYDPEGSKFRG